MTEALQEATSERVCKVVAISLVSLKVGRKEELNRTRRLVLKQQKSPENCRLLGKEFL